MTNELSAHEAAGYRVEPAVQAVCPPGYKQTEVGVIPEDWEVASLGVIADMSSGTTPPRSLMERYYQNGSIAWVKTLDLNNSDIYATEECVTELALKETSLRPYPAGAVLVAMYGGFNQIGRTGLLRIPAAVNQAITAIRPKQNLVPEYLISTLNYRIDYWKSVASSSRKDPNITSNDIKSFPIAYPQPYEQEAIAEVLSDTDALIDSLECLIAKKRQLKQGAMQELLTGKKRLPGFQGAWEVKRLGEVGEISGAGVDKKIRSNEIPVHLLNYMDVYKKDFLKSDDFSHEVTARPDQARRCSVQRGDVFFTPTSEVRDDIGHSAVAIEDIPDVVYSYHVVRLRLFENWDVRFRTYIFKTRDFLDQASTQCEGSGTRYVITLPKFRSMEIRFPVDVKEQTAIATILSDMDTEITALEARLAKARELKQGMMQELLTGRIRLI